ncbi:MAG: hypothetical protein AAB225_14595, partial [Acidobacteriota bacterium]
MVKTRLGELPGDFKAVFYVQFAQDVPEVVLDRLFRYAQAIGNLLVGKSRRNQGHNLALADGETGCCLVSGPGRIGPDSGRKFDKGQGETLGNYRFIPMQGPNRLQDI